MEPSLHFLDLDDLDPNQKRRLEDLLHPSNLSSKIEFPWSEYCDSDDEIYFKKGNASSLNVHAPAFETYEPSKSNLTLDKLESNYSLESYSNGTSLPDMVPMVNDSDYYLLSSDDKRTGQGIRGFTNGTKAHAVFDQYVPYSDGGDPINGDIYHETHTAQVTSPISSFKLNPTVSCFVPQNIQNYAQPDRTMHDLESVSNVNVAVLQNGTCSENQFQNELPLAMDSSVFVPQPGHVEVYEPGDKLELVEESVKSEEVKPRPSQNVENRISPISTAPAPVTLVSTTASVTPVLSVVTDSSKNDAAYSKPTRRSWADIVSSGQKSTEKVTLAKSQTENEKLKTIEDKEVENLSIDEDKMALALGKHLHELELNFQSVCLQPRGLINRRNWCYIHATLQALLASSPFYTLLRDLPLGPGVERGKSATPVIDSMVKVTYEFSQLESSQEELQVGQPFQPDFIYGMLKDLKSDCLKGQQEDAEEFLSFILNNMHEEMVKVIKNYEKKNCISLVDDVKENGDLSDGEEEWQVIGSKHKGMVTRKVAEHKTPISDLLGGQIKSFLTTSGSKTSASIQPFFTLQLDIQSENVNSVSEALKEMTVKEPIQGYTCAKTKQEVEAYSHIALQKLPPVLILHLKRFVYNKNGGCKKVMKKTDYPLELELSRDLFSSDVKKSQRIRMYKLFAVMYHDGEEAIKGHYISDVYNYGSQTWIRCDDRQITAVTEAQVLSHSPPRVPYLLFYQES